MKDPNTIQIPWAQSKDKKRLIHTPIRAQHVDKGPRKEDVETHHPRSPRNKCTSGTLQLATSTKEQGTVEDNRVVQVKKKGNIWVKQPLPPHSMHYTNSAGRINEEMAPKQQPHSSQHILPPPTKSRWHNTFYHLQQSLDGTSIQITAVRCTSGGLRCNEKDYIREKNASKKRVESLKKDQK